MASDASERFLQSLSAYIDAIETARKAISSDGSVTSIKRLASTLETASGRHGFPSIQSAAQEVHTADSGDLADAVDRLLYSLLNTVSDPSGRERTVLILDDDVVVAQVYRRVLDHAHHRVKVVQRASDILDVFRSQWIDLIILEISLPDLDGREVLAALRKNALTVQIPVVVTASSADPWVEDECVALGATRFLSKPVDPVMLAEIVADLLAPKQRPPAPGSEPSLVADRPTDPADGPTVQVEPGEILLAEHDALTAQIIRQRLGREGHSVRHFASGTAAWQAAKSLTPTAVILDAMTPGIDGIELLSRLRRLEHYRKLPMLVLSDIGSEREVVRALEAGADDCIRKPFSPTELVARVERLLAR